ncbi:MAG: PAS domain S-box protein [Promethearchaeota archaeon]
MLEKQKSQEIEYLTLIFDSIFDEITVLDKHYRITDVNKTFCRKYSVSKEEVIGRKCFKLTHNREKICKPPECKCPVENVLKTGQFSEAVHIHHINGEEMYVKLLAYPIKTKDGEIKQIIKIGRDITERKKIEQEIKQSESNMNSILSNVNDSIIVISKDYKILYMNRKAEEEFGCHLRGNICYSVLMNRDKVCEHCTFNKLINNYDVIRFEKEFIDPMTYEKKYFEYNCTPILNFDGQQAIIDIIRDITDRKNIEEKFRNLVENFPYSIILLDFNKKIYDCNSLAKIYLNKPKEELKGKSFFNIFQINENQLDSIEEIIQNAFDYDLSEIIDFEYLNNSHNIAWVECFFSSLKIGNKKYIQVILQDITEKKLAEKIIKEENERLRKLDQVKKELTAQTSKELKSPLNVMSNASQILLNSYKDKLDQNAIQLLELIKKGGEKSINLVERIVDISRIESDKLKLKKQTESIIEIIRESVDDIMSNMKKQKFNLTLNLSEDLYSEVDKIRIEHVIKDLLFYIIKNTSKKVNILIGLQKSNNFAQITIKNDGVGLTEKEKNRIYSKKSIFNSQESLLGLQFSNEIIDLHGGQIIFESKGKDKGAKFIIRLPIKNWADSLIYIYIIYKSGILLYGHPFVEDTKENYDSALISGGIVGILTVLKLVAKGEKQIRTVDHGDRKIIFQTNNTKDIIFALVVKEDLLIFQRKLDAIKKEFDKEYKDLVKNIKDTSTVVEKWVNLEFLIKKYFS